MLMTFDDFQMAENGQILSTYHKQNVHKRCVDKTRRCFYDSLSSRAFIHDANLSLNVMSVEAYFFHQAHTRERVENFLQFTSEGAFTPMLWVKHFELLTIEFHINILVCVDIVAGDS